MQEDPEYRRLHQILVYRAHGFGPDLIGFGDCGFIVFVFADHHLPAQVSQLLELGLQLGLQIFNFLLRAGNGVLLVLNKLPGCMNLSLEVRQLLLQGVKLAIISRGIDCFIQGRLILVQRLAPLSDL